MRDHVILVDERDAERGTLEKIAAHERGELHRAFSVFVFHPDGRLLLQKRARDKYHSGGLWTNTCCSHPRPGESVLEAAHNRLQEEMGFACGLVPAYEFIYRVEFENGLTEHEYDHVLLGVWDGEPVVNPQEVDDWKWAHPDALRTDMDSRPGEYSFWFRTTFEEAVKAALTGRHLSLG